MNRTVLITGGAGFIGSHLSDALLQRGHRVRVLDNLDPQVHGAERRRPDYLDPEVELVVGDVRDADAVANALEGVDTVFHFAAKVGVGQSMYAVENYTDVNNRGTAVLLEALVKNPVERLVVASSMSIYGEGMYRNAAGEITASQERTLEQLKRRQWEVTDSAGNPLTPIATPETKMPSLASVYALSKFDQERLCLMIGRAYNIAAVALRFFNVYGTRQALSNPYTGVLAIFASRLLNDSAPLVNEDGHQRRDFVSVLDVAQACVLAMEKAPEVAGQAFNVGSGRNYTVLEVGRRLAEVLGKKIEPEITGKYRVGDIRHCFADISLTRSMLGYEPQVQLEDALIELAQWLEGQIAVDKVQQAAAELSARGLTV
ncbi:MAG TPA: NAD-dependent epimerase/dehydratase family protein [Thermoanaerobaculia bacterium]|nr:NAD-dependent epimerase/dehydratase family protein [Thermoanaerobaculia bacterium]